MHHDPAFRGAVIGFIAIDITSLPNPRIFGMDFLSHSTSMAVVCIACSVVGLAPSSRGLRATITTISATDGFRVSITTGVARKDYPAIISDRVPSGIIDMPYL